MWKTCIEIRWRFIILHIKTNKVKRGFVLFAQNVTEMQLCFINVEIFLFWQFGEHKSICPEPKNTFSLYASSSNRTVAQETSTWLWVAATNRLWKKGADSFTFFCLKLSDILGTSKQKIFFGLHLTFIVPLYIVQFGLGAYKLCGIFG